MLALIAAQLALPGVMLAARWAQEGSRPVSELPASWQMYSVVAPPTYTGLDAAGHERPLGPDRLPPVVRSVGTGRVVPDRLCRRHPDVVAVRRTGGTQPGLFRC